MKNFARNNHAFKNDDGVITLQVVIITSVIVLAAVLASILIINLLRDESKHIEVVLASEQPQKLDPIAYSPTATAAPSKESRIPSFGYTGINHSCIVADKTIRCWGKNNEKQLGDGTYTSRSTPITVLGITGKAPETSAVQVSVAPSHTCARLENGTVKCWGKGYRDTPVSVLETTGSPLANVTQISAGYNHTCAILEDKTVKCWETGYRDTPVTVLETTGSPLANVTKISVGVGHTCALLSTKEVKCWGNNYDGELGDGTTTNSSTPVPVSGITGMDSTSSATQVSAGGNHTCVVFEKWSCEMLGKQSEWAAWR